MSEKPKTIGDKIEACLNIIAPRWVERAVKWLDTWSDEQELKTAAARKAVK